MTIGKTSLAHEAWYSPYPFKGTFIPFLKKYPTRGDTLAFSLVWSTKDVKDVQERVLALLLWDLHLLEEMDYEQIKKQGTCRLWWIQWKKERAVNESKHKGLRQGPGVAPWGLAKAWGRAFQRPWPRARNKPVFREVVTTTEEWWWEKEISLAGKRNGQG